MINYISSVKFKSGVPLTYNPRKDSKNILLTSIFDGTLEMGHISKKANILSNSIIFDQINLKGLRQLSLSKQYDTLSEYFRRKPANKNNFYALNTMGNTCLKLELYDEAYNHFILIYKRFPEDIQVLNGLGKIAFFKGDYNKAEAIFKKNPQDFMSLAWLRKTYLMQKRNDEAEQIYMKIKALATDNTHALNEIGKTALKDEDIPLAKYCFIRLLEIRQDDIPSLHALAKIAIKSRLYDVARKIYQEILSINEFDHRAIKMLKYLFNK